MPQQPTPTQAALQFLAQTLQDHVGHLKAQGSITAAGAVAFIGNQHVELIRAGFQDSAEQIMRFQEEIKALKENKDTDMENKGTDAPAQSH